MENPCCSCRPHNLRVGVPAPPRVELTARRLMPGQADYREVDLVWGLDAITPVDRSALNRWVPSERGAAIWAENFDPSTLAAQRFFSATCGPCRRRGAPAAALSDSSALSHGCHRRAVVGEVRGERLHGR